jgi:alcohol dehydrogenase
MIAPGEPLGLEEAGSALVAMGSTPSRGIVLVDPTR